MHTVLFLCTGNYYRSRYAEIVFNWLARQQGLTWQADSRGLAIDARNPGPISIWSRDAIGRLQITCASSTRFPRPVTRADLEAAAHIVAVKEAEHRPLLSRQFPDLADKVEFWHIHDIDCALPADALPLLHEHIVKLVERLSGLPSAAAAS
jgi:protein-tyrosine phosphatase